MLYSNRTQSFRDNFRNITGRVECIDLMIVLLALLTVILIGGGIIIDNHSREYTIERIYPLDSTSESLVLDTSVCRRRIKFRGNHSVSWVYQIQELVLDSEWCLKEYLTNYGDDSIPSSFRNRIFDKCQDHPRYQIIHEEYIALKTGYNETINFSYDHLCPCSDNRSYCRDSQRCYNKKFLRLELPEIVKPENFIFRC